MNLNDLSTTELVTIAREVESEAHRGLAREVLITIIEGGVVPLPQRTINKKRLMITRYLNANWEQVSSLVSCPAKTRDPWACFGCTDIQTASCVLDNKGKFE